VTSTVDLQKLLEQSTIERFYTSIPYHYYDLDFSSVELLCTIHGLRSIELPTDSYEVRYHSGVKSKARAIAKRMLTMKYVAMKERQFERLIGLRAQQRIIIVPSLHTKYSLLTTFPRVSPADVEVLYSPEVASPELSSASCDRVLGDLEIDRRGFFLLISANRWCKNTLRAVEAIDTIYSEFPGIQYPTVLLGASRPQIFRRVVANEDRFRFLGYVERDKLDCLLATAFVFVYPSLNEGFGYPPLEAMRYGTPVVCSGVAALPEICGNAAVYVDPRSIGEIKNRLLMFLLEDGLTETYARRGLERAGRIREEQERMLKTLCHWILTGRKAVKTSESRI